MRAGPPAVAATTPLLSTPTPDRRRRLSEGVLLEATIRARLLGLRLLTIDATVVLAPAEVAAPASAAQDLPPRAPLPPGRAWSRAAATRQGLAEAVQSINEGRELLAATRRDGS